MARIGKYEILAPLSLTDFSDIYIARDVDLDLPVAAKVLHLKGDQAGADVAYWTRRFIKEAKALAHLDHHNIIRVIDIGSDEANRPFMIMPFQKATLVYEIGHDHAEIKSRARGPVKRPPRALSVGRSMTLWGQLLSALALLHGAGIIHRDIKPGNILLTDRRNGSVKLTDLGMARFPDDHEEEKGGGTLEYVSPEQLNNLGVADPRADVYSAGVLLHRMLTGRTPTQDVHGANVLNPKIPSVIKELLSECLDHDPARRPMDAIDLHTRFMALR